MRKTKLIAVLMASLVLIYTSCSEKEVTQKVEDTQRVDALRNELFELQRLIFGTDGGAEGLATTNQALGIDNASLEEEVAALQAEIDRLEAAYNASVSYQVIVSDFQGTPIEGATVTLNENGTIMSLDTDASGVATFSSVRAGAIVGVVSADGYATANYGTSLYSLDEAGANTRVAMLPTDGAIAGGSMFTVSGFLYANLNVADDTLTGYYYGDPYNYSQFVGANDANSLPKGPNVEFPHKSFNKMNKKVTATIYMDKDYIPFSEWNADFKGAIQFIAYEGAKWEATIDATTNQYTLNLPVATSLNVDEDILYFKIDVEGFSAAKTLVDYDPNGTWYDYYAYDGNDWERLPNSAFPAPKTYTQNRIFRVRGYQMGTSYFEGEYYYQDNVYLETDDFGTSGLGAIAGQTYSLDFYYMDSRN